MLVEISQFAKWLRRKSPHTSTAVHYTNDLELFFAWIDKPPDQITLRDVDAFIEYSQQQGHSIATVNRRLAALRSFYHFLEIENDTARPNPVRPKRHFIRQGRRLPRDAQDAEIEKLFAVITDLRDRAMFLLMLRCGLRVGEVRALSLNDLYLQPTPGSLPRLWIQGKGGSQRVAYLSAQPLAALKAWLAIRPPVEEQACVSQSLRHAFHCHRHSTAFGRILSCSGCVDHLPSISPHLRATSGRSACADHVDSTLVRSRTLAHDAGLSAHFRQSSAGRLRSRYATDHATLAR